MSILQRSIARWLLATLLVVTSIASIPWIGTAQEAEQWLAVRYTVCPLGDTRDLDACNRRVAHGLTTSVTNASAGESVARGANAGQDGLTWIDITGLTPATFIVNGGSGSGNVGVNCFTNGKPVDAGLVPGYHANAMFRVDAPGFGTVFCTLIIYGSVGDIERYGVVETPAPGDVTPEITVRVLACRFIGGCAPGVGFRLAVEAGNFELADDRGFVWQSIEGSVPGIVSLRGLPSEAWDSERFESELVCSSTTETLKVTRPDSGFAGDVLNIHATTDSDIRCDYQVEFVSPSPNG